MFILWKDHTALEEADAINDLAKHWELDYTRFSGGTYSCEWVWAKMLHCLRNDPSLRGKAYSWVEHCDWIGALLVGDTTPAKIARSRCVAGHKAMWHESWGGLPSSDFLHAVDPLLDTFRGHLYRETVTGDVRIGGLCPEWAGAFGLRPGIAVGVGAIDCHVGAVGAGIVPGGLVKVMELRPAILPLPATRRSATGLSGESVDKWMVRSFRGMSGLRRGRRLSAIFTLGSAD